MDDRDETDLERRLAARLHPARVPGADDTWRRIAPRLAAPAARPRPRPAPARLAAAFTLLAALLVAAGLAFQGGEHRAIPAGTLTGDSRTGQGATSPSPLQPTVAILATQAATAARPTPVAGNATPAGGVQLTSRWGLAVLRGDYDTAQQLLARDDVDWRRVAEGLDRQHQGLKSFQKDELLPSGPRDEPIALFTWTWRDGYTRCLRVQETPQGVIDILDSSYRDCANLPPLAVVGEENRVTTLYPPPPFQVLQPAYLPAGMRLLVVAYNPEPSSSPPEARNVSQGSPPGQALSAEIISDAVRRARQLAGDGREATLVLIYAAGPDQFIELVQRPAGDRQRPAGDPATVRDTVAVYTQRDGRDVLTWVDSASTVSRSSFVEVYTTLGRDETQRVADHLQAIWPGETPRSPIPTPAPTSTSGNARSRPGKTTIVAPQAGREAIVRACGPWPMPPAPPATSSHEEYGRIACAARLVAGVSQSNSYGISRGGWREAAARLGLDPAVGPPGDPAVWEVSLAAPDGGGSVVILAAATGEPYLVVELAPLP